MKRLALNLDILKHALKNAGSFFLKKINQLFFFPLKKKGLSFKGEYCFKEIKRLTRDPGTFLFILLPKWLECSLRCDIVKFLPKQPKHIPPNSMKFISFFFSKLVSNITTSYLLVNDTGRKTFYRKGD